MFMTKQRKLILAIINDSMEHLTAEAIFMEAKKRMDSIAFATVYNNLNALVSENYIARIKSPGNADRFDKITKPHEHLICDSCGHIIDVHVTDLKDMIEQKIKVNLTSYNLDMHYVCEACKKSFSH